MLAQSKSTKRDKRYTLHMKKLHVHARGDCNNLGRQINACGNKHLRLLSAAAGDALLMACLLCPLGVAVRGDTLPQRGLTLPRHDPQATPVLPKY